MWGNSKPAEYLSFRVFIFGITNQSMFPDGVVYDGVEDNHPLAFRGESGANDSIVCLSFILAPKESIHIKKEVPTNHNHPIRRFPSSTTFARFLCLKHP